MVVASGCIGALRDQFTALSAAAKKKQAAKAAAAADAIRAPCSRCRAAWARHWRSRIRRRVASAATALRDLAGLEARYMALVARSWRKKTVSGADRKRYEAEIPNAFKRAADRVKRSGVLQLRLPSLQTRTLRPRCRRSAWPGGSALRRIATPNSSGGRSGWPQARQSTCITDSIVSEQAGHSTTRTSPQSGHASSAGIVTPHQVPASVAAARADRAAIAEDPVLARVAGHLQEP